MSSHEAAIVAPRSIPSRLATYDTIIEIALASDTRAISIIGTNTYTAAFGESVPEEDLADFLETTYSVKAVEAGLLNAHETNIITFVARDAPTNKVLGFVQLVRSHSNPCLEGDALSHAELRRLYVDTAAHGRGVGSKLINAVESKARAEGFKTLWLTVWEHGSDAQRLYQKLGYVKKADVDFPIGTSGNCVHKDWLLAKSL
ncbi:hypothetical protein M426DRAFT_69742 [Hypoxylon sp. CI-4A]|nr:hypothetical protein M426DRAFT_69742 [Hypoxylon sp. CI-4A]